MQGIANEYIYFFNSIVCLAHRFKVENKVIWFKIMHILNQYVSLHRNLYDQASKIDLGSKLFYSISEFLQI